MGLEQTRVSGFLKGVREQLVMLRKREPETVGRALGNACLQAPWLLLAVALSGCCPGPYCSNSGSSAGQPPPTADQLSNLFRRPVPSLVTQRADNGRTGVNSMEYVLTKEAITSGQFHRLHSFPVDGQIYGQPLFVPAVAWPDGSYRNLVVVTTTLNSVFVFDADGPSGPQGTAPLAKLTLGSPLAADYMPMAYTTDGVCPWNLPATSVARNPIDGHPYNLAPLIGITSTPVIDPKSATVYVTAKIIDAAGKIAYTLHALALNPQLTERTGSPVVIAGSVPSQHGAGASNGSLTFDPRMHLQRPALLLQQGSVFVSFGSQQDTPPFHGWMFEYDAATLALLRVNATNKESDGAGIWQAGSGPVGMSDGSVIVMTGNSGNRGCAFTGNIIDPPNQENSFLRFAPGSAGISSFRHPQSDSLNSNDLDLGSSGPVLLPGTPLVAGAGKDGQLFVLNATSMQRVASMIVSDHHEDSWNAFVRAFGGGWPHVHGTPVAWQMGGSNVRLVWPEHSPLTAVDVDAADLTAPSIVIAQKGPQAPEHSMPGGLLSLSINKSITSTALLWATVPAHDSADALTHNNAPGVLRVFLATDISNEIWNSNGVPLGSAMDGLGTFAKNAPPLIADGRVYVATFDNALAVYGLVQWASLIDRSARHKVLTLGTAFTDLIAVQNTGAKWSAHVGDRLQIRFVSEASNLTVSTAEVSCRRYPLEPYSTIR